MAVTSVDLVFLGGVGKCRACFHTEKGLQLSSGWRSGAESPVFHLNCWRGWGVSPSPTSKHSAECLQEWQTAATPRRQGRGDLVGFTPFFHKG